MLELLLNRLLNSYIYIYEHALASNNKNVISKVLFLFNIFIIYGVNKLLRF